MICHKLKRVFVHVPKCAGTSMGAVLAHLEDINTNNAEDQMKACLHHDSRQHWPLSRIRAEYPSCADYQAFAFVRDPMERAVSEFLYQVGQGVRGCEEGDESLNEAVLSGSLWGLGYEFHDWPASKLIDQGPCSIFKVEELPSNLGRLAQFLGIDGLILPTLNATERRPPARQLLSEDAQEVIREKFAADFENFNY